MKEIGGYFELELNNNGEYYENAIKVNSGRNAIQYILKAQRIKRIYVPYYTCETVIEPAITLGIEHSFYSIDEKLEIVDLRPEMIQKDEKVIYINYFGIKNQYLDKLADEYNEKLLADNTQAFYKRPIKNIDTCYSPRKFFGVLDGGYVFTSTTLNESLESESAYNRMEFMLARVENKASDFYQKYKMHNHDMCNRPLKKMSLLTNKILKNINYEKAKLLRERNFYYLHSKLQYLNKLKIDIQSIEGPMYYPLWLELDGLREFLINNKIYVATYWPEVMDFTSDSECNEVRLTKYLLALPIDQRYSFEDMERIYRLIEEFLVRNGEGEKISM